VRAPPLQTGGPSEEPSEAGYVPDPAISRGNVCREVNLPARCNHDIKTCWRTARRHCGSFAGRPCFRLAAGRSNEPLVALKRSRREIVDRLETARS